MGNKVDWYLGTVGFSYRDWDSVFYPAKAPQRSYLAHYSKIFNSVELDSTFYGTPPPERVKQWAATVPAEFRFCVKTPRQITHEARLVEATEAMNTFLERVRLFEEKLGVVLIQLPPSMTAIDHDTVAAFLEALPDDLRYAVEFRHPSWFTGETALLLQHRHIGWVSVDYLDLPKQVAPTTDFLYIRWLGRHGQFKQKDQEQIDVRPQLAWWWKYIQPQLDQVAAIYGYFNNDYSGHSPRTCNRFKTLVGLPTEQPELPRQRKLL